MPETNSNLQACKQQCEQERPQRTFKIRQIKINQVDNGYVVIVACKSFVIEDKQNLINLFTAYINAPNESEVKFNKTEKLSSVLEK